MPPLTTYHDKNRKVVIHTTMPACRAPTTQQILPAPLLPAAWAMPTSRLLLGTWAPQLSLDDLYAQHCKKQLDNSDFSGQFMRKLFPNTTIMEDSTHLMRRGMRTLMPGHSMIKTFMRGLSACIFDIHQPDVVALKALLTSDGRSDADIKALPFKYFRDRC
ncbi:hypothetical protein WJX77_006077 [Trebouxia sp. C0004]